MAASRSIACAPSPCGPALAVSRLAGRHPGDYYGHSVTRPASRVIPRSHCRTYLARLRRPVRLLQCPDRASLPRPGGLPRVHGHPAARAGAGYRRLFRRASICAFWRLGFRQSGFRHIARAARPAAPYAWARPAGFLACYGPSLLTDPGKPSGPRTPPPVRARYAGDTGSAPRGAPISSMLSAPAAVPATRHATFSGALTPHSPPSRTCSATRSARPARSASAITGTTPACDTRLGHRTMRASSPGYATIAPNRCPLEPGTGSFATPIVPVQRALFMLTRPETP